MVATDKGVIVIVAVFTTTATITITPLSGATISYGPSYICPNSSPVSVIRTGTSGGVFSATGGLTIDAFGTITPGAASTYTVTLTCAAANGCPAVTATANVTIGDNTRPVLTVPPTANIECSASKLPSNTGQATATDNCTASPTITYNTPDVITPGNCTNRYTICLLY